MLRKNCGARLEPDETILRQAIQTKRDAWLAYLKRIADKDGSGFVNAEEGRALARQIHVGLTVAQLPNVQSLDELAQLLEGEAGELAVDLNAYLELQTAAEREGLTGCPALPQKWIKAQTPLSGRGHR